MKKALFLALFVAANVIAFAQINPVSWTFSSKKIGENIYELHLVANIQPGWHLYSQSQPKEAIAQPTTFNFNKNPLLSFDGNVKEQGKLEKFKDDRLGISANQFSQKVDFIQKIKIKGKAKTNVTGKLEFQTCDDKKCLPPKTVNFTIALI
jgi:thiol:disulfide interchange protein DsbD